MINRLFYLLRSQASFRRFDQWLLIVFILGGLCLLSLRYAIRCNPTPQAPSPSAYSSPLTWRGNGGIYLKGANENTPKTYSLRTRSGDIIQNPVYNFWNHHLVYWSRRDKALCFLSSNAPERWMNLPDKIDGYEVSVKTISPTRDGILLDLRTTGKPPEVCYLDLVRNTFETVAGAVSSRGTDGYTTFVIVDDEGTFYSVSPSKRVRIDGIRIPPPSSNSGLWDYSAQNDTLCVADARNITVLQAGIKSTWKFRGDKDIYVESLYVEPVHNKLYFGLSGKPIRGRKLIATDVNGKRDKAVIKSYSPFNYPFRLADDETQRLIERLGPP